jgi:predicted ATPase
LDHVEKLDTTKDDRETRFSVYEKLLPEIEAPTISGGTARAIAMLTAMHVLNAFDPELPGLVAIEEPDTAVHPLLLWKLVEIFRYYVDVDENGVYEGDGTNRRQLFLTTHNPRLLDEFKPHEVRLVERDEDGYTVVKPVSEKIAKMWLEKYGLGEAWMTRTLGGVPD